MVSELDQLLEQQTQMDIRMSAFQHMLYANIQSYKRSTILFNYAYIIIHTSLIEIRWDNPL